MREIGQVSFCSYMSMNIYFRIWIVLLAKIERMSISHSQSGIREGALPNWNISLRNFNIELLNQQTLNSGSCLPFLVLLLLLNRLKELRFLSTLPFITNLSFYSTKLPDVRYYKKGGKMTLWLRGGEKERMHGYSVCRRFENLWKDI